MSIDIPSDFLNSLSPSQLLSSEPNHRHPDDPPSDYFNDNTYNNDIPADSSFLSDPDIREAIEETNAERIAELCRQGVVIQHSRTHWPRSPRSSSAFPETPTKRKSNLERDFAFICDSSPTKQTLQQQPPLPPPSSPPTVVEARPTTSDTMTEGTANSTPAQKNFPNLGGFGGFSALKKNLSSQQSTTAATTATKPTTTTTTTHSFDDDEFPPDLNDLQHQPHSKLDAVFDDPFTFDEDEEEMMRESHASFLNSEPQVNGAMKVTTDQENSKPSKAAEVEDESNPFMMEDEDDNNAAAKQIQYEQSASSFSRSNNFEAADSNPFLFDDEPPVASSSRSAATAGPSTFPSLTPGLDAALPTSQQATFQPPPPPPPANVTERIKIIDSSGKTHFALQYLPHATTAHKSSLAYEVLQKTSRPRQPGAAQREFYGIDIFGLRKAIEQEDKEAAEAEEAKSLAPKVSSLAISALMSATKVDSKTGRTQLWTEKYRAKRFTDLLGDERTHRHVLKWLKSWDPIVFPSAVKKSKNNKDGQQDEHSSSFRKILLISGPPGLGKTTMAHVLARQAGYEPLEINASDDRTGNVVRNRIKDIVGMETVRMGDSKRGKPVCVVIDEVDGVTGEGGGGEGGFIKALVDLILQDQKNTARDPNSSSSFNNPAKRKGKKKGDTFRFFRPIICICNDLYANSLRTLRPMADIVNTRRPPLGLVTQRLKQILEREGIDGDNDAIRRIVELEGGVGGGGSGTKSAASEWGGDVRGIMVAGEWICGRLRSAACSHKATALEVSNNGRIKLTRKWLEGEYSAGGGLGASDGSGGKGRGSGVREVVSQIFIDPESRVGNLARPRPAVSVGSASSTRKADGSVGLGGGGAKSENMGRLRTLVEASGEFDKVMSDCFSQYPTIPFHDDPLLTKPNLGYDWLYFYDSLSSKVFGSSQDYELMPYLATPALAFHKLFACSESAQLKGRRMFKGGKIDKEKDDDENEKPFTGPKAEYESREGRKANMSLLTHLTTILPHSIIRGFKPVETMAYELAPWLVQIIQPKVTPVVVGGSQGYGMASVRRDVEKRMVERAASIMAQCCVAFEKIRIEVDANAGFQRNGGFILRMEPPIDTLTVYQTLVHETPPISTRYAVRQVLDQEYQKQMLQRQNEARAARMKGDAPEITPEQTKQNEKKKVDPTAIAAAKEVKRDFFGRVINSPPKKRKGDDGGVTSNEGTTSKRRKADKETMKVWCTFKEGFSNAVRKPITWNELMAGF